MLLSHFFLLSVPEKYSLETVEVCFQDINIQSNEIPTLLLDDRPVYIRICCIFRTFMMIYFLFILTKYKLDLFLQSK